jgi:hypothetical protein
MTTQPPPAAWYPDPAGSGQLRYFDGTAWTDHYALQPSSTSSYGPAPSMHRNGLGIASLILGVIAVVTTLLLIGVFFGIAAVATGIPALVRVRRGKANNPVMALIGIVLGVLSILVVLAGAILGALYQSHNECGFLGPAHTGCY